MVARAMRKITAYRLIDVFEELARRELNFIIESRGLRDDWTTVNHLYGARLVARIKFDISSITNLMVLLLTQETHFEVGSSEWIYHQLVVDWKSICSDLNTWKEWWLTCVGLPGACCARIASQLSKNIKMRYIVGFKQARTANLIVRLQADCAINSRSYYSWQYFSSVTFM